MFERERPEALTLSENGVAVDAVEAAGLAQNLAVIYKYTGRFDVAAPLFEQALARAESSGAAHLVATICYNLGGLAHASGDAGAGVHWARRSISVREQLGDPARHHPAPAG